jgi:hypothetical protein
MAKLRQCGRRQLRHDGVPGKLWHNPVKGNDAMPDMTNYSLIASQEGAPGAALPNAVHMLRTCQAHHVTLSAMADQKANIIIGVNSVIFALVVKDAAHNPALLVLAGSSALAAVLCMLAVMPALGRQKASPQPNLLFFAGFTQLSEADWAGWVRRTTADDQAMLTAMAHDIYQLGQVLAHKKYRFLGWGYRTFIFGLVATMAVFLGQTALGW